MQVATTEQTPTNAESLADLNGRWFFAWRMAAACEDALREVDEAIEKQSDPERLFSLETARALLRKELLRWVRQGEALDMIVDHLPETAS